LQTCRMKLLLIVFSLFTPCAMAAELRDALLLHASFDGKLDADFATGDATLLHSPNGGHAEAKPGLPDGGLVVHERGAGKFGDALHFTKKMRPVVFFPRAKNPGNSPTPRGGGG